MKFKNLGWIFAVGLGATLFAGGFQTQTPKVGVVDLQTVFQNSDLYQQKEGDLKAMGDARSDLLNFLTTYPTITAAQAGRIKTLSLKTDLTPAEKGELNKLKTDVQTTSQAFIALQTKTNPSTDEVTKLNDFNRQKQETGNVYMAWQREFAGDINTQKEKFRREVLDRVTSSVQEHAKKQGYTLVFANDVAPFGANDLTADALKVMNAKK